MDESGEEEYHAGAVDPDTDDAYEEGTRYKVWVSRAPAWRTDEV